MTTISEQEFLAGLASKGLTLNPIYPQSKSLTYGAGSESRFWIVPPRAAERPYFLSALVSLLGEWQSCYAWRPHGSWPDRKTIDADRIGELVELNIMAGLGAPPGSIDVLRFSRDERDSLVTLMFATSIFGWSVGEDLYVVPDNASAFIMVSHHEDVHATTARGGNIDHWVNSMAEAGYDLPANPPDATFKRPKWMPPG